MTTKCFVSFETSGRCLLSALFLICTLVSTNVFGEDPNPDKLAQLGPQPPVQLVPVTYNPDLVNTPLPTVMEFRA